MGVVAQPLQEVRRVGLLAVRRRTWVQGQADGHALASSTAGMIDLIRNMVQLVEVSLVEAVRMATLNPARALRLESRKGILKVGADADLVSFTDDFQVTHTFVGEHASLPQVSRSTLRFLDLDALETFLREADLVIEHAFGDFDGGILRDKSPEIIIVARTL